MTEKTIFEALAEEIGEETPDLSTVEGRRELTKAHISAIANHNTRTLDEKETGPKDTPATASKSITHLRSHYMRPWKEGYEWSGFLYTEKGSEKDEKWANMEVYKRIGVEGGKALYVTAGSIRDIKDFGKKGVKERLKLEGIKEGSSQANKDYGKLKDHIGHQTIKKGLDHKEFLFLGYYEGETFASIAGTGCRYLGEGLNKSPLSRGLGELIDEKTREGEIEEFKDTETYELFREYVNRTLDFVEEVEDQAFSYLEDIIQAEARDEDYTVPQEIEPEEQQEVEEYLEQLEEEIEEKHNVDSDIYRLKEDSEIPYSEKHDKDREEIRELKQTVYGENNKREQYVKDRLKERIDHAKKLQGMVDKYFKDGEEV